MAKATSRIDNWGVLKQPTLYNQSEQASMAVQSDHREFCTNDCSSVATLLESAKWWILPSELAGEQDAQEHARVVEWHVLEI